MKKHTTHFDDCGCRTAHYQIMKKALIDLKKYQDTFCSGCKGTFFVCRTLTRTFKKLDELDKENTYVY